MKYEVRVAFETRDDDDFTSIQSYTKDTLISTLGEDWLLKISDRDESIWSDIIGSHTNLVNVFTSVYKDFDGIQEWVFDSEVYSFFEIERLVDRSNLKCAPCEG
jgi:hypothetical protein